MTDLKIGRMSPEDRLCFLTLLCLASTSDKGGLIEDCDEESVINLTRLNGEYRERAIGCLKRYEALQIVTLGVTGSVTVCNFGRRQGQNLSNAERQKNYRERRNKAIKDSNARNVTRYNDSNARIEESRVDKNIIKYKLEDMELAKLLLEKIQKNTPTFKEPNLDKWADHVRLMREADGRTVEQIKFVIEWSQSNNFWKANILSTEKLRSKFDTLVAKIKSQAGEGEIKKSKVAFT